MTGNFDEIMAEFESDLLTRAEILRLKGLRVLHDRPHLQAT